jgi:hypothetical protein
MINKNPGGLLRENYIGKGVLLQSKVADVRKGGEKEV